MPASTHHLIPKSIAYLADAYEEDGVISVNALCKAIGANRLTFTNTILPVLTAEQPDGFSISLDKLDGKRGYRIKSMGIIKTNLSGQ